MSQDIYLLTIFLFLGTVLLIFSLKYFSVMFAGRLKSADLERYSKNFAESNQLIAEVKRDIFLVDSKIEKLKESIDEVERILKQVE